MLLKDLTKIYIAEKRTEVIGGQAEASYVNLRSVMANVQYANSYTHYSVNTSERKTYGNIDNSTITVRIPNPIQAENGDGIYLSEPTETEEEYGSPDYVIESTETAYINTANIRNPMIITARLNNAEHSGQASGKS